MAEELIREEKQGKQLNILTPGGGNRPVRLREIAGTEDARFSTGIGSRFRRRYGKRQLGVGFRCAGNR